MYIQSECTVQMYTDYAFFFCLNIMANKSIPAVFLVHKNIEEHVLLRKSKKNKKKQQHLVHIPQLCLAVSAHTIKFFGIHIFPTNKKPK